MAQRISEATRYTVCYTLGGTEQRFECTAPDRDGALGQLKKRLEGVDLGPITVLRIVPRWLGRVG